MMVVRDAADDYILTSHLFLSYNPVMTEMILVKAILEAEMHISKIRLHL